MYETKNKIGENLNHEILYFGKDKHIILNYCAAYKFGKEKNKDLRN